ncbi:hypothetical protein NECAME_08431 [Necator americanus]|uniref:Oxysterol-binding protein n=1 Tax=Necator americanus TaxID=51031 RepID=W2TIZ9_NECAM|nr:hypothetical protein NECAME_08431 [Necator americanus]ETN81574.1 hypothetical protein NECAME_08431 [Necator americanus]
MDKSALPGAEITWNTWAQTCEFSPERPVRLQLHGEDYTWNKITTHIENLLCIPEERKLFHEGTIHVRCSNGVAARINVKRNKDVSGEVTNSNGKTFCRLFGKWDEQFSRQLDSGKNEELIVVSSSVLHAEYFGFSDFTMGLNELHAEEVPLLPPTDSRLRPDVRNLENGNLDKAIEYKQELEKASEQHICFICNIAQRSRAMNEETYKPLWFEQKDDDFTKTKIFISTGKYWEAKQTKFEQQKRENAFIPIFNVSITT